MSKKRRFITLLTDFGDENSYLAELKGVILSINPDAEIVEATERVRPGNIRQGAYLLGRYFNYYPEGTIHLAVVDPGVGSERLPILLKTESYFFVGPDNGLFSYVVAEEQPCLIVMLANRKYQLAAVSHTFHGRDLFAPAAAYISLGIDPREFGPEVEMLRMLGIPHPQVKEEDIEGEILHIDHFGNAVTNIPLRLLEQTGRFVSIELKDSVIQMFARSYEEGKNHTSFVIAGSGGTLEISSFGQDAAARLGVSPGDKVYLKTKRP